MATVTNSELEKRVVDFLKDEKTGEGKNLSKAFKDELVVGMSNILFESIKKIQKSVPMRATLPESDAGVMSRLPHKIGEEVYYVIYKQVRSQVKGTLQVKFGWQFTVLFGKVEEILIRQDNAVIYKINGDNILADLTFKSRDNAEAKCKTLNAGTAPFAVKDEKIDVVNCSDCEALVEKAEAVIDGDKILCTDCANKIKEEAPKKSTKKESAKEVKDGEEDKPATTDIGCAETSPNTEGKSN